MGEAQGQKGRSGRSCVFKGMGGQKDIRAEVAEVVFSRGWSGGVRRAEVAEVVFQGGGGSETRSGRSCVLKGVGVGVRRTEGQKGRSSRSFGLKGWRGGGCSNCQKGQTLCFQRGAGFRSKGRRVEVAGSCVF